MKDSNTTIILVDFNQATDTTLRFLETRKGSNRNFYLLSFTDSDKKENTEEKLKAFKAKVIEGVNIIDSIVKEGKLEDSIEEVVSEVNATAIVFLLNPDAKKGFFSSPRSLKLISSMNMVFVVLQHGAKLEKYSKIAMPLELTSESKQKIEPAITLAQDTKSELSIFLPKFKDEYQGSAVDRNIIWSKRYLKDKNIDYNFTIAQEERNFEEQFIDFIDTSGAGVVVILNYSDNFLSGLFKSVELKVLQNKYKVPVLIMNHKSTYRSSIPVLGQ